jgi:beta-galactosidase
MHTLRLVFTLLVLDLAAKALAITGSCGSFEIKDEQFMLNDRPFIYRAGEIHPPRVPKEYWRHRLQMLKAMGLNTVGVYLFWNKIEPRPGEFDWSGQADYPEFFRIAKEEGMWVIVRPGPYVCAEWDGGGHPWWLGKDAPLEVRSMDPKYFEPAKRYLTEAARVIAPFQITRGGPIILYQIENEYSKADQAYLSGLMKIATDNGIEVPLIACNPPGLSPGKPGRRFKLNYRDDLFQTANFMRGSAKPAIELLKQFKKTGPYACGEYYPGWFDYWGRKHAVGGLKSYLGDLSWMLENQVSFSIYMAHGGTNFGFWASGGPNTPLAPICTSYDYDAPLSEAGWVTEKFIKTRELLGRFLQPGETLPDIPAHLPTTSVAPFRLTEYVPVFETGLPLISDDTPRPMEAYDQGYGAIIYQTTLPAGPASELKVGEVRDFAWIFLDGQNIGSMDRRSGHYTISPPARDEPARLEIFIIAMGRNNLGTTDLKGLIAPVTRILPEGPVELRGWQIRRLPCDAEMLASLRFRAGTTRQPAFWRGTFELEKPADTFLDTSKLGHGVLWVNGHNLGRYWNIGPQQTLFCPGAWLKPGRNEVIVLECLAPETMELVGLERPILDQLRPELDFLPTQQAK